MVLVRETTSWSGMYLFFLYSIVNKASALWSMLVALCVLPYTIISPHKDAYLHMTDSTPESRQDIRKHSSKTPGKPSSFVKCQTKTISFL